MRGRLQFHLEQAKMRTRQRLSEGRAKPVDVIVQTLYFPDDFEAEAGADPYTVMRGLTLAELRDLRADVEDYQVARDSLLPPNEQPDPTPFRMEAELLTHTRRGIATGRSAYQRAQGQDVVLADVASLPGVL